MSRYGKNDSTRHAIVRERDDEYVISWTVDFYYSGSRQRFPRRFVRDTNKKGAERFAKKWRIAMPSEPIRAP